MMRYAAYLKQRYKAILGYSGFIWGIIGLLILAPLPGLVFYEHERAWAGAFLIPGLALATLGFGLWKRFSPRDAFSLTLQEGALIVLLVWSVAILVGMVPFMLMNDMSFAQAVFEATSGWTTTGLSVLDVAAAPHLTLLYRSIMQWAGGAGFAIMMLTALTGPAGTGLSSAEGREEQLEPHVRRSAELVLRMYLGYTIVGMVGLRLAGMDWFDAFNHACAALSTGGFSTRVDSIGFWDSPLIEAVVILLMLVGATNFLTVYALLNRKFKAVARTSEVRLLGVLICVAVLVVLVGVTAGTYPLMGKAIRVAIFEVVSAISTTGFATVGYTAWRSLGWLMIILLMLIGGGSGSTAGGIKLYRVYVSFEGLVWQIKRVFLPPTTINEPDVWKAGQRQFLNDRHIRQAALFVSLHLAVFVLGSGIIAAHGYSLRESLFEFASAVSTVGLSVGVTAANAPPSVLWTLTGGMFLGRLEFFPVIVGVIKVIVDGRAILS